MSSLISNEFSVTTGHTGGGNPALPAIEWSCQQAALCSYTSPFRKDISSPATFADLSQYRSNLEALTANSNEITLQDGSALYGTTCPSSNEGACEAVLYYLPYGQTQLPTCPIGTELVVSATGTSGAHAYTFTPAPRVKLVGELPSTCIFVNGGYQCDAPQATLRFTEVASPCDVKTMATDEDSCPFPLVGRPMGTCDASLPCSVELN